TSKHWSRSNFISELATTAPLMVTMTVSADGEATSIRPPPVWVHLPLFGVTWPWRSYSVIDTGGAGAAPGTTVMLTAAPGGTAAFSWAGTSDRGAAAPSRPRASRPARPKRKLRLMGVKLLRG